MHCLIGPKDALWLWQLHGRIVARMCVCVQPLSLYLSLASCMLQARLWHVAFVAHIRIKLPFSEGTRNRLRCVSRMCPSDAVATVTAIKHQIMHAHSTSSSSCNVAHEASLRAPPRTLLPASLSLSSPSDYAIFVEEAHAKKNSLFAIKIYGRVGGEVCQNAVCVHVCACADMQNA